jgi:hypothetical protein
LTSLLLAAAVAGATPLAAQSRLTMPTQRRPASWIRGAEIGGAVGAVLGAAVGVASSHGKCVIPSDDFEPPIPNGDCIPYVRRGIGGALIGGVSGLAVGAAVGRLLGRRSPVTVAAGPGGASVGVALGF